MGGYTLPVQISNDPSDPTQNNPYGVYGYNGYGGFSPYSGGIDNSSQNWGTAVGAAGQDVSPSASISDITSANRNQISTEGNVIAQQGGNELNYYGPLQQQYTGAENQALNELEATPGFTPDQSAQINADYSQFNTTPDQYSGITNTLGTGVGAETGSLTNYGQNVGQQLANYETNLSGEVGNYDTWTGAANTAYGQNVNAALGQAGTGIGTATSGLATGLQQAQGAFQPLNAAVNNTALGFDPNQTEQQLTPAQQQAMVTAAGTTVGNQFQQAEDTLQQQAAAQGNTSPAALAAMRQQLVTQEAATAGDTMTQAAIQAEQAGFQQASSIEQQREAATQTQAGLQATAATTEEAAAQAAAAQAGQTNVAAQEYLAGQGVAGQEAIGAENANTAAQAGAQGIAAANTIGQENVGQEANYGQFATGEQNTITGQNYNNALTQAQMQYQQGTGSQQLTSQGAQAVGNAQQAGMASYRSGVAGQEAQAQQGGQAAVQAEQGAYGTQTSGINQATQTQANYAIGKPSLGDQLASGLVQSLFAEGGVPTEPTIAKLGERGPEMVVPVPRYKSQRKSEYDSFGKAA